MLVIDVLFCAIDTACSIVSTFGLLYKNFGTSRRSQKLGIFIKVCFTGATFTILTRILATI